MPTNSELAIARDLNRALRKAGLTIAVAEGSSGGRIGERLVRYAGATAFFKGSVVTYDYASRTALLGIPQAELRTHGSVSEWSVRAMAEGVRERFGTDLGLASSGVTGPRGTDVGHLWLAIAREGQTLVEEQHVPPGSRLAMQAGFTELALRFLQRVVG
jgi:nicotinamide-nucleotide amidase